MITGNEYKKIIMHQLETANEICSDIVKYNASEEILNYIGNYTWIRMKSYDYGTIDFRIEINVGEIYAYISMNNGEVLFDEEGLRTSVCDVYDYVYRFLAKRDDDWFAASQYIEEYEGNEIEKYSYKSMN